MKKYILFSIIVFAVFISTFAAVPVQAENAPYVNAAVADNEFNHITAQCMDVIRSKKILLASRSWGFGMRSGLYTLPDSYGSIYNMVGLDYSADYDVRNGGLSAIPTNAFSLKNFVHYVWADSATGEMDQLIRNGPHNFKDVIDVAMLFGDSAYPNYFEIFDALRSDFPNIKFIYTTIGFESSDYPDRNSGYATYSAQIRATYQGIAPLYDEGLMCNDDGRCGDQYCPEYSTDPAGLHPNTIFINERLAKGFLVLLSKLYCETPSTPTPTSSPTPTPTPTPSPTPSSNPVAWWKLDETSGITASDSSGNGYIGTLVNGPVWTSGKIGGALSFDGVNDYVSANIPSLSSVTISAWVRTPVAGSTLRIIDANGTVPLLRFDNSSVQFIGNVFLTSNTTFLANQWYHLVAVGDATGHKLYVNGSLDNSNSTAYSVSNGSPVYIGGSLDLFNGFIDDVRVYNRALSISEVQTLYNAGTTDTTPPAAPTGVRVN